MVLVTTVYADSMPGFRLPIIVQLIGTPPTDYEDYNIILEADNPDYPMPEGSVDGRYRIIIKGEAKKQLPEIEFSSVDVYTYKIS